MHPSQGGLAFTVMMRATLLILSVLLSTMLVAAERRVPGGIIYDTRFYRIDSDVPVPQVRELGRQLDAMHADYRKRFGAAVRINGRLTVRFFATRPAYEAYGKRWCNNFVSTWKGYYFYAGELDRREMVLVVEEDDNHLRTARHEGFHQFIHVGIGDIFHQPQWFNEGLAELFEQVQVEGKRVRMPTELSPDWKADLKKWLDAGKLVPVAQLFSVRSKGWNDPELRNYATAYAMVHMLSENRKGAAALVGLLRGLAGGKEYDQAHAASIAKLATPEELDVQLKEWLAERFAD
jgi:hypothetical protein